MAFSKKENMNPEEWLKEEASWQLGKIIDALNACLLYTSDAADEEDV